MWEGIDALSSSSQAASTIGVEMDRVDRGIVIVPCNEQRSRLHDGHDSQCPILRGRETSPCIAFRRCAWEVNRVVRVGDNTN